MSSLRLAVEDRKADAVAHLAAARSQNTGPAFWGNLLKIKTAVSVQLSFSLSSFIYGYESGYTDSIRKEGNAVK